MFRIITERLHQKYRTVPYPAKDPVLPPRFKGRPVLHSGPQQAVDAAVAACPTGAFFLEQGVPCLDMGLCTFCAACERAAPEVVTFSANHRLAGLSRSELVVRPDDAEKPGDNAEPITPESIRKLFKRSFRIREVSAAGCNACEADCNVLTTVVFDLARFGIDFVASPRHADAMLVTGPVPRNMHLALQKCWAAMPGPKVVIAVGACAISGGLFKTMDQDALGVSPHLDIDVFIPGCPPSPYTILNGLLRFLHRDK
ncbi:hydrogenase [Desulfovibrio sp. OttesenSCG-928-O18]|nr:hydrogenase [Desulfovibrio sp. OttesenSCG-928-O18]